MNYLSFELLWSLSLSWRGVVEDMSLTCPLKLNGMEITLSLLRRNPNREDERGLVKMSASWSLLEINLMNKSFFATKSRTKWKSISTCFVLAWKTGFEDKYVAPILSHQRVGAWENLRPISEHKDCSQDNSAIVFARALYSASVLEQATVCCVQQFHEIRFWPKKIQ